jgi:hypothetical protein
MTNGNTAIEKVADVVETVGEETIDVADVTRSLAGREITFLTGGLTIGFGIGFGVGYLVLKKKFQLKYEQLADEEITAMRQHYEAKLKNAEPKPDLEALVQEKGYVPPPESKPPVPVQSQDGGKVPYHQVGSEPDKPRADLTIVGEPENVFTQTQEPIQDPEWDYATEVKSRGTSVPYVIHRDEYIAGEMEFEQIELTYYEGDDVLADARDQIVRDQDAYVGLGNLSKFGHGSLDPKVVYVRNPVTETDIEITHSDGTYAHDVQGVQDDELRHSGMRSRHRRYDDGERT